MSGRSLLEEGFHCIVYTTRSLASIFIRLQSQNAIVRLRNWDSGMKASVAIFRRLAPLNQRRYTGSSLSRKEFICTPLLSRSGITLLRRLDTVTKARVVISLK